MTEEQFDKGGLTARAGIDLAILDAAARVVYQVLAPTPQIHWPLLSKRCGAEVWVKHENHTPIGAFKLRGGVTYMRRLKEAHPKVEGVITATRGNHGQSIALAARQAKLTAVIVVPHGNNPEKNAAMRAFGCELIEEGEDYQAAAEFARALAGRRGLHFVAAYHPWLIEGVGTYGLEFLRAVPDLEVVYVPIGMGSGVSGVIAARNALKLKTRIVGVVAEGAPAYALSFAAGKAVSTDAATTIADGLACRVPDPMAVDFICAHAERVVTVSDGEIKAAMRVYFTDTHNIAEGAGAAPLAALLKERRGGKVGLVLSGGNADQALFREVLG
ncbi:MAG: hypothetical protein A3G73_09325 [Rhodospirillales bacterium RIFCSPLOWO2_12_FULL_67_15]|nr:MAG: hypothetical protein A3G73_09325 [Rhodospirillales bacterium RIFCSPLOWO2_12_FULL_67_15]